MEGDQKIDMPFGWEVGFAEFLSECGLTIAAADVQEQVGECRDGTRMAVRLDNDMALILPYFLGWKSARSLYN